VLAYTDVLLILGHLACYVQLARANIEVGRRDVYGQVERYPL
jgi:hypothetical protein